MIFKDCIQVLERVAPPELKESWDNVGLMIGDETDAIRGILFSLDVTEEVAEEAASLGCNLIISHHPLIFQPIRSLNRQRDSKLFRLIESRINVYSMHTNLDCARDGVNDRLAECFELQDTKVLCSDEETGLGRIGRLPEKMSFEAFLSLVKSVLNVKYVRYVGDLNRDVRTVAVLGGAGADYLEYALKEGADVMLTAEVKHHIGLYAKETGIALVDAGHFETENIVLEPLMETLRECFDVPMYLSKRHRSFIETI